MQSTLLSPALPRVDVVYAKTVMGQHEVQHRSAGLTARQRAALIMLDGQRDASVLAAVMPVDQVATILAALLALELIATESVEAEAEAPAPRVAESGKLAEIKAELIGTAETYLGVMAREIVARVRQASDEAQLLRVLGHWHMAMQDSKHGKDAARTLLERSKLQLS